MTLAQSFKMAFQALSTSKMRSFLTMLGIIIGVLAVCVLVSVIQGASSEITGQFDSLGGNTLIINLQNAGNVNLTLSDLETLVTPANGISGVSPIVSGTGAVKSTTKSVNDLTISGVAEQYFRIRSLTVEVGRGILRTDVAYNTPVCVIGVGVADDLFGQRNVVGNTINVYGRDMEIVGLLEEEGSSAMLSNDDTVFLPFSTAQRLLQNSNITQFYVASISTDTTAQAKQSLNDFLSARVRSRDPDEDAYTLLDQAAIMDVMNTVTGIMAGLLGGIASISLLVGGIGIMNIMLVSVTERTREIGIRKAIGAKRKHILTQFLIEALVISLIGGLIGLGLSWLTVMLISHLMGMSIEISAGVTALALGFSAFVGLGFGIYPAAKASNLTPIEALRYE